MEQEPFKEWLLEQGYGTVVSSRRVGGGCINDGMRLLTSSGSSFFLKKNSNAPQDMFAREAEGLEALRAAPGPRFPRPYIWGANFLLLEDLNPSSPAGNFWSTLGLELADLHSTTSPLFGFTHDNYIGSTPQPNANMEDGYTFYAEQRLLFQAKLARRQGLLHSRDTALVESLAKRLPELIPAQPASLIHGDLWSGNAISDEQGKPALIDPAAYYGWAEAELAMTALFGGFPPSFYRAYEEVRPLEKGYQERFPIYNLYHLLNHLNLFGTGYLGQVQAILRRYAG